MIREHLPTILAILGALGALGALASAIAAIVTYHRSVRARRAKWLSSLHENFFETERYAEVRRILDYSEKPAYSAAYSELRQAVAAGNHSPLVDEFFRYLNFFELLASLHDLKQIGRDEILALFEYDLKMIADRPFILDTLKAEGFERLPKLLQQTKLVGPS